MDTVLVCSMDAPPFPTSPDEMSSEWLESSTGFDLECIKVLQIGEGSGFAGSVYRILVSHRNPSSGLPKSVIWKTTSGHRPTHFLLRRLGAYKVEAGFYSEMAGAVPMAPKTYFAGHDPGSGSICIVMEDLSGLMPGDQVAGCSEQESNMVVAELALLHSRFWGQTAVSVGDWVPSYDAGGRFFQRLHSRAWSRLSKEDEVVPQKLSEVALAMTGVRPRGQESAGLGADDTRPRRRPAGQHLLRFEIRWSQGQTHRLAGHSNRAWSIRSRILSRGVPAG